MKISQSFNRFYFGGVIRDIQNNLVHLRWNGLKFDLRLLDTQGIHTLLKIITDRIGVSLTDMDSKEVVAFLEDIRLLLAENDYTLTVDNEEWDRVMAQTRKLK